MKEEIYYRAIEYFKWNKKEKNESGSLTLTYPRGHKYEFSRKFKTYNDAKEAINNARESRKKQYTYYRDKDGNLVDKISFYEQHEMKYKIFKIKEISEILYEEDNSQVKMKEANKDLQAEMPLW